MTRKRISEAAFYKACQEPRRRYSSLSVAPRGRVRVASPLRTDWHCIWFEVNQVHDEEGTYYFDDESYSVYMFVDAVLSAVFYVEGGAVLSVSFSAQLSVDQLRHAARSLEDAGLGRFVADAARQTLQYAPPEPLKVLGRELKALTRRSPLRRASRRGSQSARATGRRKHSS